MYHIFHSLSRDMLSLKRNFLIEIKKILQKLLVQNGKLENSKLKNRMNKIINLKKKKKIMKKLDRMERIHKL